MNREVLKKLVSKGKSTRQIGKELGIGQSTVRYWLKKYDVKTKHDQWQPHLYLCECCGTTTPSDFRGHRKSTCGKCQDKKNHDKQKENRRKVREHMGGKCFLCGFDKYKSALDAHHTDPSKKDPNYKSSRSWNWSRLEKELQLCVLVCKNCHSAIHSGEINEDANA